MFDEYGKQNCNVKLIENYPCDNKNELQLRESYYIRKNNCYNKIIPGRTKKQYNEDNKEKIKEYNEVNKEKIKEEMKKYRENNKEKERLYSKKYHEDNREKEKVYRENNREKIKKRDKKYYEENVERIRATRLYQNTWCGNFNHNNHNNLLRIDPKLFEK